MTEGGVNLGIRAHAALRLALLLAGDGQAEAARPFAEEAGRLFGIMGNYGEKAQALRLLRTLR